MPDITMCNSEECCLKGTCYRNPASGTKPSEYRQAWFLLKEDVSEGCNSYWPLPKHSK